MDKLRELLLLRVNENLKKRGWNYTELGKKMNKSPQALHRILKGKNMPGLDKLAEIAAALNIPVYKLLLDLKGEAHSLEDCLRTVCEAARKGNKD